MAAAEARPKKKLPTSSWLVYLAENREELLAEQPNLPFTEVTKVLGERYRKLTPEEKKQLSDVAEANRAVVRETKLEQEKEKNTTVVAEKYSSMELTIPAARTKRIIQSDPDVSRVSSETVIVVAKAAEYFLEQLALSVVQVTGTSKRKTTKIDDVVEAIHTRRPYAFLRWDFPRSAVKKAARTNKEGVASSSTTATSSDNQHTSRLKSYFTTTARVTDSNANTGTTDERDANVGHEEVGNDAEAVTHQHTETEIQDGEVEEGTAGAEATERDDHDNNNDNDDDDVELPDQGGKKRSKNKQVENEGSSAAVVVKQPTPSKNKKRRT